MSLVEDYNHAVKMLSRGNKALVLGINFLGGCLGPWGIACSLTWTVGYLAGKSKEVDYRDPQLIKLVIAAQAAINKRDKHVTSSCV